MKEYWTIVNQPKSVPVAIKMTEVKPGVMETIAKNPDLSGAIGIPIYFSPGFGAWPKPSADCIVVKNEEEEI